MEPLSHNLSQHKNQLFVLPRVKRRGQLAPSILREFARAMSSDQLIPAAQASADSSRAEEKWSLEKTCGFIFLFVLVDSGRTMVDASALFDAKDEALLPFFLVCAQSFLSLFSSVVHTATTRGRESLGQVVDPQWFLRFLPTAICYSFSQAFVVWAFTLGLTAATAAVLGLLSMPLCALMSRYMFLRKRRYGWLDILALLMITFCSITFAELRNKRMGTETAFVKKEMCWFYLSTALSTCGLLLFEKLVKPKYTDDSKGVTYRVQRCQIDIVQSVVSFLALVIVCLWSGQDPRAGLKKIFTTRVCWALPLRIVQNWMSGMFAKKFSTTAKGVVQCLSLLVIYFIGDRIVLELHEGKPLAPFSKEFTVDVLAVVVALSALLYQMGRQQTTTESPDQITTAESPDQMVLVPLDSGCFCQAVDDGCDGSRKSWAALVLPEFEEEPNNAKDEVKKGKLSKILAVVFFIALDSARPMVSEHVMKSSPYVTPQTMVVTSGALSIILDCAICFSAEGWKAIKMAMEPSKLFQCSRPALCFSVGQTLTSLAFSFKISGAVHGVIGYSYMPLAAVLQHVLLGRPQSLLRWLGLLAITLSAIVFITLLTEEGLPGVSWEAGLCALGSVTFSCLGGTLCELLGSKAAKQGKEPGEHETKEQEISESSEDDKEKEKQKASQRFNLQKDTVTFIASFLMLFIVPKIDTRPTASFWKEREIDGVPASGFFVGWNLKVVPAVVLASCHSFVSALVAKQIGNVAKSVANCISLLPVYVVGDLYIKQINFQWPVGSMAIVIMLSALVYTWSEDKKDDEEWVEIPYSDRSSKYLGRVRDDEVVKTAIGEMKFSELKDKDEGELKKLFPIKIIKVKPDNLDQTAIIEKSAEVSQGPKQGDVSLSKLGEVSQGPKQGDVSPSKLGVVCLVVLIIGAAGGYRFGRWRATSSPDDISGITRMPMQTSTTTTTPVDSCCWKIKCLNLWDKKQECEPNAQGLTTSYRRLWEGDAQMKVSFREDLDRIVASKDFGQNEVIQQAIDAGGYDCHEGDKEQPQSEQLKADVEFMKKYADDPKSHLIHNAAWAKAAEAFELVLGNALATYPPVEVVIRRYTMAFLNHNGAAAPAQKPAEFAKNYEGACFAGFTPDLSATTSIAELKRWIENANSRELLTKFYKTVGDFFSTGEWQNTPDKRMCSGSAWEVKERILDHRGIHPRFRMPYKDVGLGWMNVQMSFFPGRGRLAGGWGSNTKNLRKYNVTFKWPRKDTLDPELSHDEEARIQTCQDSEEVLAMEPRRVPWIAGRFGLFLQEDSPLWLMSQITGLPVRSGVSGSTLIMLSSAETMHFSVEEMHLLRLAMIGWMVPAQDHSLMEVLMGALQYSKGRSYPKWSEGNATAQPTRIEDWKRIHRNLLPQKFSSGGATLSNLNEHIDKYIRKFNEKHGTSVEWPDKSTSSNPWWTHEVFDYITDDLAPQLKKLPKEIAPDPQCEQTVDKKNNYRCFLSTMKDEERKEEKGEDASSERESREAPIEVSAQEEEEEKKPPYSKDKQIEDAPAEASDAKLEQTTSFASPEAAAPKADEKPRMTGEKLGILKWRWAENYVPGIGMVKKKGFQGSWNTPANRDALVEELMKKTSDPEANAKQYHTRAVEFADVDFPERRRTFGDYTKALDWLTLELNIQSREEL